MGKVEEVSLIEMYQRDMTIYKITVNGKRMAPDYRDGLIEVVRRFLDVMCNDESKARNNYVKSGAITGTTMKKSHPHSTTSIYGAIASSTQWYKIYMPLVTNEANFGNFQGAGPAAERYTEIKLSDFCKEYVLKELMEIKEVSDWYDTYIGDKEPVFLPTRVPLLLINGNFGLGVGTVAQLPPHNINEVIDETIKVIDDPNHKVTLIPDQCMPCEIIENNWTNICNLGDGNFKVRGIIQIKDYEGVPHPRRRGEMLVDKKYDGCKTLVIRSLPDLVTLDSVTDKVEELMKDGALPQIIDSIPASTEFQPNHIFVLKKGVDPEYVRSMIYSKTQMQKTAIIKFLAMDGTELTRFSYTSYIQAWLEFRKMTKFRLYCNKLQKSKTRYHQIEAYIKALESGKIDEIIDKIKKRKTTDDNELIEYLIKTLKITDLQASYIINAGIKTLSLGYLDKYKKEFSKLKEEENCYMSIITNDTLIINEIRQELLECKQKYGSPRRCKVIKDPTTGDIPSGEFKIVITEAGFIKKLLPTDKPTIFRGDRPKFILKGDNRENLILCNEQGRVFKLPINKVPLSSNNSLGYDLRIMLKNNTSQIVKMLYEPKLVELAKKKNKHFFVVLTEKNNIKKIDIEDILVALPSGIIYTKLQSGDKVIDANIVPDVLDIIIYSNKKALRCSMKDIPHYRKNALGVNAMDTDEPIDGFSVVYPDATDIIVITNSGRANVFNINALPTTARYKKGNRVINLGENDYIRYIFGVDSNTTLKVVTANDTKMINVSDIPSSSSASKGTKLISTKGDTIIKVEAFKK